MARGSFNIGSKAWKERQLKILAAQLAKTDCPNAELESFLKLNVDPKFHNMARDYFTELMATKK